MQKRPFFSVICLLYAFACAPLFAAQTITLDYIVLQEAQNQEAQPIAKVHETFSEHNQQYRIESSTKGIGVYALMGKRVLTSEGRVTAEGLQPLRFNQQQNGKILDSQFDWANNTLNMHIKGEAKTAPLAEKCQDIASFTHQWRATKTLPTSMTQAVATGRKIKHFLLTSEAKPQTITVQGKAYQARYIAAYAQEEAHSSEEPKKLVREFWLNEAFIPVKIKLYDDANTLTQELVQAHITQVDSTPK